MTTANKGLAQPTYNSEVNTWGIGSLNDNFGYIDLALGGSTLLNATGLGGTTVVLTQTQCRPLTISVSGVPGGIVTYTVPSGIGGQWIVRNGTTGGYAIRIQSAAGGSYISIGAGDNVQVSCDGTATGMVRSTTSAAGAAGSNTWVQYNAGGVLAGSVNFAFDGTTVSLPYLRVAASAILGSVAGDTLTLYGNTLSIPNTMNIGAGTLFMTSATKQVGINTYTLGSDSLSVGGTIKSTAGGFVFPDASVQTTAAALPPGVIVPYAAASAPSGWLICAAQAVSRTTYSALFAVIGTTYGVGDGSTTFNLPDLRGRVIAGVDNQGGYGAAGRLTGTTMSPNGNTIGAGGGAQTVTLTAAEQASMPVTGTFAGTVTSPLSIVTTDVQGSQIGNIGAGAGFNAYADTSGGAVSGSITGTATGSGGAHGNVQPTTLMYYIIKT